MVRILFIGDIMGEPGRKAVSGLVPHLIQREQVDLVIANSENAAAGKGVTPSIVKMLLESKVDLLTSGNHAWDNREGVHLYSQVERLLRPANYPKQIFYPVPGKGALVIETKSGIKIGVLNLIGRVFMDHYDCPFQVGHEEVAHLSSQARIIIVDFHAQATSEKKAMGLFLDGKVSAVLGTHTHVQTADEQILSGGTAYISDAGMTGPHDSVIGMEKQRVIEKILNRMPQKFEVATGDVRLQGVLVDIDEDTGKAKMIRRVDEPL